MDGMDGGEKLLKPKDRTPQKRVEAQFRDRAFQFFQKIGPFGGLATFERTFTEPKNNEPQTLELEGNNKKWQATITILNATSKEARVELVVHKKGTEPGGSEASDKYTETMPFDGVGRLDQAQAIRAIIHGVSTRKPVTTFRFQKSIRTFDDIDPLLEDATFLLDFIDENVGGGGVKKPPASNLIKYLGTLPRRLFS